MLGCFRGVLSMNLLAATTDVFNDVHECCQFERFVHEPIHTCVVRGYDGGCFYTVY